MILFPSGMTRKQLLETLPLSAPYRAKQIYKWIAAGATSFIRMSNLSISERTKLNAIFPSIVSSTVDTRLEDPDGSIKLALRLRDGSVVECVLLEDIEGRKTACLSSQVGCPMGCAFCKTGSLGYLRNLGCDEIMEQFHFLQQDNGPINNIVFMGMGEPMLNLQAVRQAIQLMTDPEGIGISRRKITISTCGIVPGIHDLADNGPAVRLAISLTAADNTLRSSLMPVNRTWNLETLKDALLIYQQKTGERITLELALMGDANVSLEDADRLITWCRGLSVQINLIPWNPVPGINHIEPTRTQVDTFLQHVENAGLLSTRRMRRGRGVMGACGQLGNTLKV